MRTTLMSILLLALVATTGCEEGDTYIITNNGGGGGANSGTIDIAAALSVPAQNISKNLPGQTLCGFDVTVSGTESVAEGTHKIHLRTTSGSLGAGMITSIQIYNDNNVVVAGPFDAVAVVGGQDVTFTDTVTYPSGTHTYTLKGKVPSTALNDTVVECSTNPHLDWGTARGTQTGDEYILPNTLLTMSPVTVKVPSLGVALGAFPSPQTILAGSSAVSFATIQFDSTSSGEDISLPSIPFAKMFSENTYSYLSGCQIFNGATPLNTGANVFNPQSTEEEVLLFDTSLVISKGTVPSLLLKCNVSSGASGSFRFQVSPASELFEAVGGTSGSPAEIYGATSTSAIMTIGGSSLTISTKSTSQPYQIAAGNSTGVTSGAGQLCAFNESIAVNQIGLSVQGSENVSQISLWGDGGVMLGSEPITSSMSTAIVALTNSLTVPQNECRDVVLKSDLNTIGIGEVGQNGTFVKIDITSTGTRGTGNSSGLTITPIGNTNTMGMRVFKTYPIIAAVSIPSTGAASGHLMRFKATVSSKGDASFAKGTFRVQLRDATGNIVPGGVTNVNLYGYTDTTCTTTVPGTIGGQLAYPSVTPDANGLVRIRPPAPLVIPAGMTYCFDLRGTVNAPSSVYTITTTFMGDAQVATFTTNIIAGCPTGAANNTITGEVCPTGVNTKMGTVADLEAIDAMTIWSPNGQLPSSYVTSVNWTNGYGVFGLPGSGITQVISN